MFDNSFLTGWEYLKIIEYKMRKRIQELFSKPNKAGVIFQTNQSPKSQISLKQPKPFQSVRTIVINNAFITWNLESSTCTSQHWSALKDFHASIIVADVLL
jgi:hypothetical protein